MGRAVKLLLLVLGLGVVCQAAFAGMLLDLTNHGLYGSVNGAWFIELDQKSTGSGVYDAFLQLQESNKDADTYELGYNSDYGPTTDNPELGSTNQHNHTVLWSSVPLVRNPTNPQGTIVAYGWFAEFRSDINELAAQDNRYLSMDKLEIWVSQYADLGGTSAKYYSQWASMPKTTKIWDFGPSPAYDGVAMN